MVEGPVSGCSLKGIRGKAGIWIDQSFNFTKKVTKWFRKAALPPLLLELQQCSELD